MLTSKHSVAPDSSLSAEVVLPYMRLAEALWIALLAGIFLYCSSSYATAAPYSRIVVFGDSISDTGSLFIVTRETPLQDTIPVSPPYFEGRFSNGPVWVEALAGRFSLRARSFLDGGTNYAFGGAETAQNTSELFSRGTDVLIPSVRSQVSNLYLGSPISDLPFDDFPLDELPFDIPSPAEEVDPSALYIVQGGPNDLRNAIRDGSTDLGVARRAARALARAVEDLAGNGAIYFLVPNMPDLGQTPEGRELEEERRTFATSLSVEFNRVLDNVLETLRNDFAIQITQVNVFERLREVTADPQAFGLSNVTDACLTVPDGAPEDAPFVGGEVCDNPDDYLFWDFIHPSTAAHALLADFAFAALPPLVATPGEENPDDTVEISGSARDLPVLQLRLGTTAEMVQIAALTLTFSDIDGDTSQFERLQARLIDDTNSNGAFDQGEEVLATQSTTALNAALTLEMTPPLMMEPSSTRHLLVVLDFNRSTGSPGNAMTSRVSQQERLLASLGGLMLPVIGLTLMTQRRRRWLRVVLALLIVSASLILLSCVDSEDLGFDDDGEDRREVSFTVGVAANGIRGQTAMGDAIQEPPARFTGATVELGE